MTGGSPPLANDREKVGTMEVPKETKELMTRYLLGKMSPVEQEDLENRYAAEPEVFEQLVAIENELADRYARRELSAEEQSAFERHVLAHPRRRARVEFVPAFALQLEQWAQEDSHLSVPLSRGHFSQWWRVMQGNWIWSFGLVTAALLMMVGGWWLWRTSRHTPPIIIAAQPDAVSSPLPEGTPMTPSSPEVEPTITAKAVPAFVTLTLRTELVRGNENADVPTLMIPLNTDEVRLRLKAGVNGYARYRLALQNAEGKALLSTITSARSGTLPFTIAADLLIDGEYFVTISGLNPNGEADALSKALFRVSHQKVHK